MKFRRSESKKKHFKGAYDLLKAKCTQNKNTKGRIENKTQAIHCPEYLGYGHVRIEFPNYLKFKDKTINVILRDESNENGSFMASTVSIGSESVHDGSSKEELDEDDDLQS